MRIEGTLFFSGQGKYRIEIATDVPSVARLIIKPVSYTHLGEGIGFCVSVCDEGSGEPLWYVLCATSSYGPDPGFPRTVDKGAPSAWPAAHVYVSQPIFPFDAPDRVAVYARYVAVK